MDFWIKSPTNTDLETVIKTIPDLWQNSSGQILAQTTLSDGTQWVYVPWGLWWKPTGQTYVDSMGNSAPIMANDGNFYALCRWNGDPASFPFNTVSGATVAKDSSLGTTTITIIVSSTCQITMSAPLPADVPISF